MAHIEGVGVSGRMGNLLLWAGTATVAGGVASVNPTEDGTPNGAAVFGTVIAVVVSGEANTGVLSAAPVGSLKTVSADRKTVTVNVMTGTVLGILGATILPAPDGTKVHVVVVGY